MIVGYQLIDIKIIIYISDLVAQFLDWIPNQHICPITWWFLHYVEIADHCLHHFNYSTKYINECYWIRNVFNNFLRRFKNLTYYSPIIMQLTHSLSNYCYLWNIICTNLKVNWNDIFLHEESLLLISSITTDAADAWIWIKGKRLCHLHLKDY